MSSPFLVDVVLPLALPGAFTYALPENLAGKVIVGSRVVVPLGKRKQYTAIVVRCPGTPATAGIQIKENSGSGGRSAASAPCATRNVAMDGPLLYVYARRGDEGRPALRTET